MARDVQIIDRGYKAAVSALREMDRITAKAGVIDNPETALYGLIHEARTGWMRDTVDDRLRAIDGALADMHDDLIAGRRGIGHVETIAADMADAFRAALEGEGLEDTGALIESIGSEVSS